MKHWINQHLQALALVVHRIKHQWLGTLLVSAVIGVTLAIPSLLYVAVSNLSQTLGEVKQETQLSVFLSKEATEQEIETISASLKANSNIKSFKYVPKNEALEQLMASSQNSDLVAMLDNNPLPDAFFISPNAIDEASINELSKSIAALSGVDTVIADNAWMKRLNSFLLIGQQAVWILAGLLGFALIAVISNIIRMQVLTHKDEIEVSELFGATKSFIRRPFLYLGSIYGLLGGMFACLILFAVKHFFNQAVSQFTSEYQADFSMHVNTVGLFTSVILLAISIGWLASYVAVTLKTK
jgi:cell division transport system permease protein